MARLAKKDTFMYEVVGPDVMRRAQVFAGQLVPDSFIEGEDTEPDAFTDLDKVPTYGFGAAPHAYKHQVIAEMAGVEEDAPPNEGNAEQESVSRQARRGRAAHAQAAKKAEAEAAEDE
jgi:hypothetical protein